MIFQDLGGLTSYPSVWTSAGQITLHKSTFGKFTSMDNHPKDVTLLTRTVFLDPGELIGFPASEVPLPGRRSDASEEEYRSLQQTHR